MRRTDVLLAIALGVASLAQVLWIYPIASPAVGVLVAVGSSAPLAVRRTHPVAAALVVCAAWLVPTDGYLFLGYVMAFVLFYSVAVYVDDLRVVVAVTALGVADAIVATALQGAVAGEYFGAVSSVAAPAVVGRFVRRHRVQARRLEELTVHLERERERGARAAVAEERARIARELHDVVAHGVSVIAIQSDAAEAALERDPALARTPLQTIRGSAREAMAEMRRLLGVLHDDGDGAELAPQPGLAQLEALVERARQAGVPVELRVDGEPRPLAASADLSAYRIVQEALTNVRKHAPGAAATVEVLWRDGALELRVTDDGPGGTPADGGHGLIGMRERVRLHGGELVAGPRPEGGFAVHARLPMEPAR
ncbi:MAG TPA: sensor histidine kinase [Capillimicrobium sp.]|nr:sensor histidine kinase [Capillimicrobium sp.]